ncbi:MAG: SCO family protein [Candidatus Obscuribacterales bacterium]|nr:SCO family protein [Steroidobacteraceae bacterium]
MPASKFPARTLILVGVFGIVAALSGALLAQRFWRGESAPALTTGTLLQPPRPLPDFALVNHDGHVFTSQNLQGHWSVLFFGFTNCPDICPTTLTLLAGVNKALANVPVGQRPRMVFVSADAQRDKPEHIKTYVQFFDRDFVGVTGTQPALEAFALSLGAPIALRELADGNYTVDHSGTLFVTDPQGALRAIFSGPHQIEALVPDLRALLGVR